MTCTNCDGEEFVCGTCGVLADRASFAIVDVAALRKLLEYCRAQAQNEYAGPGETVAYDVMAGELQKILAGAR